MRSPAMRLLKVLCLSRRSSSFIGIRAFTLTRFASILIVLRLKKVRDRGRDSPSFRLRRGAGSASEKDWPGWRECFLWLRSFVTGGLVCLRDQLLRLRLILRSAFGRKMEFRC